MKTFIKEATILSVYDFHENEKVFIGDTIYGVVTQDETDQLPPEHRLVSTTIEKQNGLEFVTKKGAVYVASDEPNCFEVRLYEFVTMREFLLSPAELLELRERYAIEEGSSH